MNSKDVAKMFGITVDTIRYYERVGVIPPIEREENGYRIYTKRTLNWIFLAKSLRNAGLSVESLIEFASLSQMKGNRRYAQKQILKDQLQEIDEKIDEINKTRELLQYKIDTYDEHIALFEAGKLSDDQVEELWKMKHFKNNET
ncbi:MerR family transcriptional regulator [Jeotgalibaca ciconiae]|uniref:MerR family transcriptional regulator n=1 Tax=Jeotgalibaca ciconiae TaxID=2496265 RepID=A0A3Q9BL07_9LACT|nr:MerR family transcriptional regulator [Jeotgalibaca ciconiae]AZP03698.1 MerR family transcriptional regulator [Jeotgalibaca ciconiae]HJB23620.1 MerR family transcriptional regulator [Candidatus Jeotgalibaca pullicola]